MSDTVLFVDDEANTLQSINRIFADVDMQVLNAANADEALEVFNKKKVSVIVTENSIAGMSGVDLLSEVRKRSPDTLKILMTGQADLPTAVDAINRGEVFRFVLKPWNDKTLMQIVGEAIDRYNMVQSMKNLDRDTLISLVQSIELKDPYTRGHSERVCKYASLIADKLGLSDQTKKYIEFGSWLHDCGKIDLPEKIMAKKGPLEREEYDLVKNHPRWGADVARQAQLAPEIIDIIHYHHERFDGSGYPVGLKETDIPLEARIMTVADVFDALMSDRAYRRKFGIDKTMEIMAQMKGNVLDPEILDIFLTRCLPELRDLLNLNSETGPNTELKYSNP
jgi:putative nucleotidyltransferase with HDIG domain